MFICFEILYFHSYHAIFKVRREGNICSAQVGDRESVVRNVQEPLCDKEIENTANSLENYNSLKVGNVIENKVDMYQIVLFIFTFLIAENVDDSIRKVNIIGIT